MPGAGDPDLSPRKVLREGVCKGSRLKLWSEHAGLFTVMLLESSVTQRYEHKSEDILLRYIEEKHGPVKWSTSLVAAHKS